MAAMAPERSRTLHNFSLPPRLNWGTQRLLRCAKLNNPSSSNDDVSVSGSIPVTDRKRRTTSPLYLPPPTQNASFRSPPSHSIHEDNQIEVIREKLMLDLRSEVDKFRAAFLENSEFSHPPPPPPLPESRPWNLRTRRSPATAENPPSPMVEVYVSGGDGGRPKFSVALSRQEIEDDFVGMIGRRAPRKPKKRPRYIQKELDTLFPGLWLSEISADLYKVNENSEPPKS